MTQLGVELAQLGQVVGIVGVNATQIALNHGHAVGGQGSRLVRTYSRRVAHCLTSVQVANQIIVLQNHATNSSNRFNANEKCR